jgi:hypothetical protein
MQYRIELSSHRPKNMSRLGSIFSFIVSPNDTADCFMHQNDQRNAECGGNEQADGVPHYLEKSGGTWLFKISLFGDNAGAQRGLL